MIKFNKFEQLKLLQTMVITTITSLNVYNQQICDPGLRKGGYLTILKKMRYSHL